MSHANQTGRYRYNKQEISSYTKETYGIQIRDSAEIKSGIMNTSVKVKGQDGIKYVLRIYRNEPENLKRIERELEFMDALRDAEIPVPKVFTSLENERITILSSGGILHYVILFSFISGRHLRAKDTSLIDEVGAIHGRMQQTGKMFTTEKNEYERIWGWLLEERETAMPRLAQHRVLASKITEAYENLIHDVGTQKEIICTLPRALCHLDYDSTNILVQDIPKRVSGIIDFDDLASVPTVLDMGFSLWWWCYNNPRNRDSVVRSYITAYKTERNLSVTERILLPLFIRIRNLTLLHLLFVNLCEKPNLQAIKKALALEEWLKRFHA